MSGSNGKWNIYLIFLFKKWIPNELFMYRKESMFWCGPHDTNTVLIKLLFLVIFQIVCIFGSCMPRSNHLLTVPEARSAMQSQTNFTTDLCYLCPSVRPSVWRVRSWDCRAGPPSFAPPPPPPPLDSSTLYPGSKQLSAAATYTCVRSVAPERTWQRRRRNWPLTPQWTTTSR